MHIDIRTVRISLLAMLLSGVTFTSSLKADDTTLPADPTSDPTQATTEAEMKPYKMLIPGTEIEIEMIPIPGGVYTIGSPEGEEGRNGDEGPQRQIKIEPFWMSKYEITWDQYDLWTFHLDVHRREVLKLKPTELDLKADLVTHPTRPYMDMTFGMGHHGYPAICMTQLAAKMYGVWLSTKTGHYYRLPTEAEWEYACRAGTKTAYSFGDDPALLDEYAWHLDNADFEYKKVGLKKPNPWGLYDMHGNVAEWVLDGYIEDIYSTYPEEEALLNPVVVPTQKYHRVVRGGSWDEEASALRSASRAHSIEEWKVQDPQLPKSEWYLTDALHVGFRLVRPLRVPSEEERKLKGYDPIIPSTARIFGQGKYDENKPPEE